MDMEKIMAYVETWKDWFVQSDVIVCLLMGQFM